MKRRKSKKMLLNFIKMHGCGNDYIYVNGFETKIDNPEEIAINLSRRHFSIGSDGLILVCPSEIADAKMRMFNADGSEGKMCGNGVRCVAKFVYDNNIAKKDELEIETLSGVKKIKLFIENDTAVGATVDMGAAEFNPDKLPVKASEKVINATKTFGGKDYKITCVSMGNPHCVIFVDDDFDIWNFDIEKEGKIIENDEFFPEKTNVEFVKKISEDTFEMRVWERGSGETFACGTGACGTVAAAIANGLCEENTDIYVKLKGGTLKINCGDTVEMTGEAVTSFYGSVEI